MSTKQDMADDLYLAGYNRGVRLIKEGNKAYGLELGYLSENADYFRGLTDGRQQAIDDDNDKAMRIESKTAKEEVDKMKQKRLDG